MGNTAILVILIIISLIYFAFFVLLKYEDIKIRSMLFSTSFLFPMVAVAGLGKFVEKHPQLIYLAAFGCFLILGLFHLYFMYRKKWATRNSADVERDSFWPELCYTLFLGFMASALFFKAFGYFNKEYALYFTSALVAFPFPFFILKSYDYFSQIRPSQFEKKWRYPLAHLHPNDVTQDGKFAVFFEVHRDKDQEKSVFTFRAKMGVPVANVNTLGNVFRYAVTEYNKQDNISTNNKMKFQKIDDLGGYEQDGERFWWLFYVKFKILQPNTWFRPIRYLDAEASLVENGLLERDVVVAKRIFLTDEKLKY